SLYTSPPRPHLHSFPTRRSSDLSSPKSTCGPTTCGRSVSVAVPRPPEGMAGAHSAVTPTGELVVGVRLGIDSGMHPVNTATDRRSEEHTSELQSRFDLVCRLLLE